MLCINCKTQLPDEAKYCLECGEPTRGDSQLESQVPRIIREELGEYVEKITSTLDKNRIVHAVASVATTISVLFAAITYYEGSKREADIAASEALMRHFDYAAYQGQPLAGKKSNASSSSLKYDSVVAHAIYTANTIIDVTETTDERPAWRNTVEHVLLAHYEGDIAENLSCNDLDNLDSRFIALLEKHSSDNTTMCPQDRRTPNVSLRYLRGR